MTVLKSTFLMIEGFTCYKKNIFLLIEGFTNDYAEKHHPLDRGFHQMTASNAVPEQTIIALLCVQTHYIMLLHCCAIFFAASTPHCCVYTCTACALFKDKILCLFWNNYTVSTYKFTLLCVNISYTHCCCIYCISIQ